MNDEIIKRYKEKYYNKEKLSSGYDIMKKVEGKLTVL